jgi:hypothetical protein
MDKVRVITAYFVANFALSQGIGHRASNLDHFVVFNGDIQAAGIRAIQGANAGYSTDILNLDLQVQ